MWPWSPSSNHIGILTSRVLYRQLFCWEFMCSIFLSLRFFLATLQSSGSYTCPAHLPWCSLSPGYRSSAADVLFRYGHFIITCFLHFGQFWVSAIDYICCKKKLFEWLRTTLICGCKNEYLEGNWIWYQFSKSGRNDFLESLISSTMDFWIDL